MCCPLRVFLFSMIQKHTFISCGPFSGKFREGKIPKHNIVFSTNRKSQLLATDEARNYLFAVFVALDGNPAIGIDLEPPESRYQIFFSLVRNTEKIPECLFSFAMNRVERRARMLSNVE